MIEKRKTHTPRCKYCDDIGIISLKSPQNTRLAFSCHCDSGKQGKHNHLQGWNGRQYQYYRRDDINEAYEYEDANLTGLI